MRHPLGVAIDVCSALLQTEDRLCLNSDRPRLKEICDL
jgi:hypothetical protein